jgi:hypothetical protein
VHLVPASAKFVEQYAPFLRRTLTLLTLTLTFEP